MPTNRAHVILGLSFALCLGCVSHPATGGGFASPEQIAEMQIERLLSEQAEAWRIVQDASM